ncbi:hypothetical protein AB0K80_04080 [Streptomyces sp. NPDC052682]|uniref:hypothetical protein n=1 Tax=Streptomyces sp. NPDC052682 TaxID=3154954 RepID=UPI00341498E0
MPPPREVPHFAPVRVRGGRGWFVQHRRQAVAAGLTVTAAALVAAGPQDTDRVRGHPHSAPPPARAASPVAGHPPGPARRAADRVTAPVRIADAAAVRLLRPGDRVDVIAAAETATGGEARVVARGARVRMIPEPLEGAVDGGALVVLSVPRATAARLAGASTTRRLAVTLW